MPFRCETAAFLKPLAVRKRDRITHTHDASKKKWYIDSLNFSNYRANLAEHNFTWTDLNRATVDSRLSITDNYVVSYIFKDYVNDARGVKFVIYIHIDRSKLHNENVSLQPHNE